MVRDDGGRSEDFEDASGVLFRFPIILLAIMSEVPRSNRWWSQDTNNKSSGSCSDQLTGEENLGGAGQVVTKCAPST